MHCMTRQILWMAIASTITTATWAKAANWPVEIFEIMDDQTLVIFLQEEDIAATPRWQPAKGGPPLTVAQALDAARRWIGSHPRLHGARIDAIELKPIHDYEKEHRWYYLLQLHAIDDDDTVKVKAHYAAVLFSGKVVPAIAEPASTK